MRLCVVHGEGFRKDKYQNNSSPSQSGYYPQDASIDGFVHATFVHDSHIHHGYIPRGPIPRDCAQDAYGDKAQESKSQDQVASVGQRLLWECRLKETCFLSHKRLEKELPKELPISYVIYASAGMAPPMRKQVAKAIIA